MSDDNWKDVTAVVDIPPGSHEIVETDEHIVAVFNVNGEFYAIEDICTHDGEELTGGPVDGDQIICPRHGARFCLRSGKALTPPAYEDLPTYSVRVRDGRVEVEVE